jgi:hypothetical protein
MTNTRRCRAVAAVLSFVTTASIAPAAAAQDMIGRHELSAWIGRNHPNVIAGDVRVNAVLIVVDTNSHYVASVADSLPLEVAAAIDSMFASVGAHNEIDGMARELVAGRLRVPGAEGAEPVYIVDGVRVSRVDSLSVNAIERIWLTKGAEAASKFGPDAATRGAIVVTMIHPENRGRVIQSSHRERLMKLGIRPDRIDFGNTQIMHVRAGIAGPNPMYITVLRLKRG